MPSALCLLLISNFSLSLGYQFPYLIRTYPKSIFSYNTIPTIHNGPIFTSINKYQKPRTQSQTTINANNNVENLMFSDEQYLEQRKIDDRDDASGDATSDLHPIYVLPPPNFQPIVYPYSQIRPRALGLQSPIADRLPVEWKDTI